MRTTEERKKKKAKESSSSQNQVRIKDTKDLEKEIEGVINALLNVFILSLIGLLFPNSEKLIFLTYGHR